MARYLVKLKLVFGVGFNAIDEQHANEKVDKIKNEIKTSFEKTYGNQVKITGRIKIIPF